MYWVHGVYTKTLQMDVDKRVSGNVLNTRLASGDTSKLAFKRLILEYRDAETSYTRITIIV